MASPPRTPGGHRERLLAAMAVSIEQKGYRDTSVDEVLANTGFTPRLAAKVETIPAPEHSIVELIRRLDPLRVHEKEIRAEDMRRGFEIA